MTDAANDVMIVNESIPLAGVVTWWRLSGVVDADELAAAWEAQGLGEALLPSPTTPLHALRSAMGEHKHARRLVRPLGGHDGFALVSEKAEERDLRHGVLLTAQFDAEEKLRFEDPGATGLEAAIALAYERALRSIDPGSVGYWLARVAKHLAAVSLRDTGGVYFVPQPSLETWKKVVAVVREVSTHHVSQVPAMRSSEAVAAVLDAIEREAQAEVEQITSELAAHNAGDAYGKRALETRITRCAGMDAKVAGYEALLDKKLDTLRAQLESLRAQVSVAILTADEKPEAASA